MSFDPVPSNFVPDWMKEERTRMLTKTDQPKDKGKSVVYWMQRDVRTADNWALLFAGHLAKEQNVPLHVVHVLPPPSTHVDDGETIPPLENLPMSERHGNFLLGGLELVHQELKDLDVPLHICTPSAHDKVAESLQTQVLDKLFPSIIICDFTPIRHVRQWMEHQLTPRMDKLKVPVWQVDAHNVVPVWHAADKRQIGARTLRPRIHKVVNGYLQKFPKFEGNKGLPSENKPDIRGFDMGGLQKFLKLDPSVKSQPWMKPGTEAAKKQFSYFIDTGLSKFSMLRNDPNAKTICSGMSPWINHGHFSFQRCIMAVKKLNKYSEGTAAFIEEGLVRRELSDNYLFYTPEDYDKLSAALEWAQETLRVHTSDKREYVYSLEELETSKTHDDLWNAAQMQVVQEGRMHGFLRMYWAKKILEWTPSPEVALHTAQYFNDKYALDGKDPNGFVGVGWSIMGIHDQGWKEREIFGKIRYMNYAGCKRKFKIPDFVKQYKGAKENAIDAEAKHAKAKKGTKRKAES
jgi:deoxyribodipyrimidine photo-lyase